MQKKRWMHRVEEIILVFLILLNAFDFFGILPADLDYVKKIISWTALGYLLYKVSLTKIFFNNPNKIVDFLLIISYFMLIVKNIIVFSIGSIEEFIIFYDFQKFLVDNAALLEFYSLVVGSIMILVLAIYSSLVIGVKKPSLMNIIHEEGKPNTLFKYIIRIITVYVVYISFFIVVFNLVMEWIAVAIHAPLIMLAILFYLFIIIRHYRKYGIESLIYQIGEFGERFYRKFISLFHYKKTIILGISGMLVLHLLTDAGSFILPYIFNFDDTLYFSQLGPGHEGIIPLFIDQIKNQPFLEQFSLFLVYIWNTIGIIFFLLLPSFFWYMAFSKRKFYINKFKISLIFSSVSVLVVAPIFEIKRITQGALLGVDIQTKFADNLLFDNFFQVFFLGFLIFISTYLLLDRYKWYLTRTIMLKSFIFFTYYIYLFFTSLILYYIGIIRTLFDASHFILSFYFLIFFTINIMFYVGSFIMFIDELIKEKVYKKFS